MRVPRDTWRRESRERPVAMRLAIIGMGTLSAGAVLAGSRLFLLAQLVAGVALLPLSLAVYLRMLPSSPWSDGRDDGGGPGGPGGPGGGGDDRGGPRPSGGRDGTDWERFERKFRAYVEEREVVHV